jgi:hypothetical protein
VTPEAVGVGVHDIGASGRGFDHRSRFSAAGSPLYRVCRSADAAADAQARTVLAARTFSASDEYAGTLDDVRPRPFRQQGHNRSGCAGGKFLGVGTSSIRSAGDILRSMTTTSVRCGRPIQSRRSASRPASWRRCATCRANPPPRPFPNSVPRPSSRGRKARWPIVVANMDNAHQTARATANQMATYLPPTVCPFPL